VSATPRDHYETLGVARDASSAAVKAAYFKLVRVHTPEDDPAGFQAISEAYAVLSDPQARESYDADERLPQDVAATLAAAGGLFEKEPDRAVAMVKGLVATEGRSATVRLAVATFLLDASRAADALPILEALRREKPQDAVVAARLGRALLGCKMLDDAETTLHAALELDPKFLPAYLTLANVHDTRGLPAVALATLDHGIATDTTLDLRTLPLRVRKLYVLAQDGRWDEMERVVAVILSLVPKDDKDAAQHAAWQLASVAQQYDQARIWDVAKFAIDASLRLVPHEGMKKRAAELAPFAARAKACRAAAKDSDVADWLRALLPQHFGRLLPEKEWQAQWKSIVARIRSSPRKADREWKTLQLRHPDAAATIEEHWKTLRKQASGRVQTPAKSGFGLIAAFAVMVMAAGRACSSSATSPSPARSNYDTNYWLEREMRNVPKLEDSLASLLKLEEKRLGRKMTQQETDAYLKKFYDKIGRSWNGTKDDSGDKK
jgi:tetratricopeptide (TPR) repeat protein